MRRFLFALLPALLLLSACESVKTEAKYPDRRQGDGSETVYHGEREGMFGKGGIGLFGKDKEKTEGVGITVNAYLWRAALDTVSFMPIASADPFGGTILTDWYSPGDTKGERVKVNVIILSRELRSDAIKVTVFRQVQAGGGWKDAVAGKDTATGLENAILSRARQMKVAEAAQ